MNRWFRPAAALAVLASIGASTPAAAGGFAINEKGSMATAIGGAFVAMDDDLSAMYYNPAAVASNDKLKVMVGVTLIPFFNKLEGASPFPGAGYNVEMKKQIFFPPNLYVGVPIAKGVNVSLGTWAPFGLSTAWEDPDTFRGRFISQRVDLRMFAASLQVSAQLADWVSVGAGPELRLGDVKLQRNQGVFNPFTAKFVDVAHVDVVGDGFQSKVGWTAGVLFKPHECFRLGVSYHSAMDVEFTGNTTFYPISTGSAQLDGIVATRIPFNTLVPTSTVVQFPSLTMMGAAVDITDKLTASFQADYWTWKVFDQTVLKFESTNGIQVPDSVLPHKWENTWGFRFGLKYKASKSMWLGAGFLNDQTPQPDEDTSPLLPDANRTGYSIGAGLTFGSTSLEFGNLFLFFRDRTTSTNKDNFNGTYKTFADLLSLNIRHSF